jgi:hypothetical protein
MKMSVEGRSHLESLFKRVAVIIEDVANKDEGNGTSSLYPSPVHRALQKTLQERTILPADYGTIQQACSGW